jgi:predicted nucleic acid-binding protein
MTDKQPEPCFVDTNIWLYGFIEADETDKSKVARELIRACHPVLSVQVINEVCVNLIKKAGFSEGQIQELIKSFYEKYSVVELDQDLLLHASKLRQSYALSFWDSLVISSALIAGVQTLYTEDFQHGQVINQTLRVLNPFVG